MIKNKRFEDWQAERMNDPEFRAAVENLEPKYQAMRKQVKYGWLVYLPFLTYYWMRRKAGMK